jgi:BirA family biotin operon repressor/biotin-[acetyl-CoA-carboxylase] ligase
LKWPNDCLIDGKKFAGILIEGEGAAVVVGVGVNCVHHPSGTTFPATDLATAGVRATPESVFSALSAAMVRRLAQWSRGDGFAAIRADWLAHAAGLGKPVHVTLPDGDREGRFETVAAWSFACLTDRSTPSSPAMCSRQPPHRGVESWRRRRASSCSRRSAASARSG